jgi:polyisoprenoid-binding protein YceI
MKIQKIIVIIVFFIVLKSYSQNRYITKEGYISFFSHTIVEDIKADNFQVLSVMDKESGEIAIQLLMKSFMFKKALMQEHFNGSYVESFKYPKATFKGFIQNLNEVDSLNTEVTIKGILSIHGKDKEIEIKSTIDITKKAIVLKGDFMVEVADFDIKIPIVVRNNIAKKVKVSFELNHEPYE